MRVGEWLKDSVRISLCRWYWQKQFDGSNSKQIVVTTYKKGDCHAQFQTVWGSDRLLEWFKNGFALFKAHSVAFCLPAMRLAARGLNVVPFMLISSSLCAWCIQPLIRFSCYHCSDSPESIGPCMSRCVENQEIPVSYFLRW